MNRRKFLKIFASSFLTSIPFLFWGTKQNVAKDEDSVIGIAIFDSQGALTDTIVFDEPLSDYDIWLARNHFNYKFQVVEKIKDLEWIL